MFGRTLRKCKSVNIYSLVVTEYLDDLESNPTADASNGTLESLDFGGDCLVNKLHLEFVSDAFLQQTLFQQFLDLNGNLRQLHLTSCSKIKIRRLPNRLEQLYIANTIMDIATLSNLECLECLVIAQPPNTSATLLDRVWKTLPGQTLRSLCISDSEEENKALIKRLTEKHNLTLRCFSINGRICMYAPFSDIFLSNDSKAYPKLEIIGLTCASVDEIESTCNEFPDLRVLDLYYPFVTTHDGDVFQWFLDENNAVCESLVKLEVLLLQAFPQIVSRYVAADQLVTVRQKIEEKFHRKNNAAPSIIFDFPLESNRICQWQWNDIQKYLKRHQDELELNYGSGI